MSNPSWRRTSAPLLPPPSKKQRVEATSSSRYEYAGAHDEALFPDGKTTLNNVLQIHLHRLGEKLEYAITSVHIPELSRRIFRASVTVPYPKPFVAYGEGESKKEAEKRSSSAACAKLCELGVIDERGKRVEKHHGLTEEQTAKTLEIALDGQITLFEAIACLPQAQTFPNWHGLKSYYDSQKRINPNVGNALFRISFSCGRSGGGVGADAAMPRGAATSTVPPIHVKMEPRDPRDPANEGAHTSHGSLLSPPPPSPALATTTATVVLPARFRALFPPDTLTPLTSIPCPSCREPIAVTVTHGSDGAAPTEILPTPPPALPVGGTLVQLPGRGVVRIKQEPGVTSVEAPPTAVPDVKAPPPKPAPPPHVADLQRVKQEPAPFVPDSKQVNREPLPGILGPQPMQLGLAPVVPHLKRVKQEPDSKEEETQCMFTGRPYQPLAGDGAGRRNEELKLQQEDMRKRFAQAKPKSPQYTAQRLPVAGMRNAVLTEINTHPVVIVSGSTGSGKSTQVPQYILENYIEHGIGASCNIIVTQPRRISAISIAERVAAERGESIGVNVGYQVRLEAAIPQTPGRILYCTTGILLMRLRKNPFLEGVSHVIVDEVHERDVNTDFLLILLREIAHSSSGVKVVLMSASLDANMFVQYFRCKSIPKVPAVNVEGRCYPVTDHYLEEISRSIGWRSLPSMEDDDQDAKAELVAAAVTHLTSTTPSGAILVFLPGWDEIMSVLDLLGGKLRRSERYLLLPLHSMLSSSEQQKVFHTPPSGVRKIVLATNIAESSVTIDDVVCVVNTGTVKLKTFDPLRKMSCLVTQFSSQASVTQRRGRAGRCQPGHCYNLFTKAQFQLMSAYQVPEIQRTPLEELVLLAKVLNPWQPVSVFLSKAMNPPNRAAVSAAVAGLVELGALDGKESLTPMGKVLAELPIEPRIGRLILLGAVFGTLDPILTIAASLGYKDPFVSPPSKRQEADQARSRLATGCYSDHLLLVHAHHGWCESIAERQEFSFIRDNFLHRGGLNTIEGLRKQFLNHLKRLGLHSVDTCSRYCHDEGMIRAVLTAGLYPSVVRMAKMIESGGKRGDTVRKRLRHGFKTIEDGRVFMHPSSVNSEKNFPSNWFVYHEKVKTTKVFVRDSTLIHPLHLLLFAGSTLTTDKEDDDVAVVRLDGKELFSFEMPLHICDLLRCAREAIKLVMNTGLSAQALNLGQLPEPQTRFMNGLCTFLSMHAGFSILVE